MHYSHLFASNRVDAQFSFPFGEMWSFMSIFVIINRKRQLFYFHVDFVCSYCIFFSLCVWHSEMKLFVLWTMVNILDFFFQVFDFRRLFCTIPLAILLMYKQKYWMNLTFFTILWFTQLQRMMLICRRHCCCCCCCCWLWW